MGTVVYATVNGRVLSQTRSGVRSLYSLDPLGNTRALYDNTGAKTDTFTYTPFGTVATHVGTTTTPFQWNGGSGYYQNSATRVYVRARNYYANLGKWSTQDPIGFKGGDFNLYRYVNNRVMTLIDPSGLVQLRPALGPQNGQEKGHWEIDPGCIQKDKCGAFKAYWYLTVTPTPNWALVLGRVLGIPVGPPSVGTGPNYIVQWVRMWDCDKVGKSCQETHNYCESWTIKPGDTSPSYPNENHIDYDDGFTYPGGPKSGIHTTIGIAKFFKRETIVPGTGGKTIGTIVDPWKPDPNSPARGLPTDDCSTWFNRLASDDWVTAEHYAVSSWDCSDADPKKWKSCSNAEPH